MAKKPQRETIQRSYLYKHLKKMQASQPDYEYYGKDRGPILHGVGVGWRLFARKLRTWLKGEVRRTKRTGGIGR